LKKSDSVLAGIVPQVQALQSQRQLDPADAVEQFFNTPIPEALWHYTTLSGLEGILRSGKMWATEARHTTDAREFVHVHDLAISYLNNLELKTDAERHAKQACLQFVEEEFGEGALSQKAMEVFVASFSSAENLKSQWNEYSDKGSGVSIAFNLRQVRPPKSLQVAATLAPCVYNQQDAEKLLQVALGHYFRSTVELLENTASLQWVKQMVDGSMRVARIFGKPFDEGAYRAAMQEEFSRRLRLNIALTQFDLLRLASHCKDPYFLPKSRSGDWLWRIQRARL
jgi:hypothetical protein